MESTVKNSKVYPLNGPEQNNQKANSIRGLFFKFMTSSAGAAAAI